MKGTVVSTWMKSCRRVYSDAVVNAALEANRIPSNRVFNPLEDIDDSVTVGIMNKISELAKVPIKELWYFVGLENIKSFAADYSGFFQHDNAFHFLKSMNDVHVIVMRRFKGAKPPILDMEPISNNSAYFTYRSKREMFDYFRGLIDGVANHFGEKIDVVEISRDAGTLKLKLTFEHSIRVINRYWINRILSLGFIKFVGFKTAVLNALVVYLAAMFMNLGMDSILLTGLVFGSTLVVSSLLNLPFLTIIKDVRQLKMRNFADIISLKSNDHFETINKEINAMKIDVQKDFIGFNGIVDEMLTFNKSVSRISENMGATSADISRIVRELANGAVAQAEDTEKSIVILNSNLKEINQISRDENENKVLIEDAVINIEESFANVKVTADKISEMLVQFSKIRDEGDALKSQAANILSIVSIVSKISQQTSLLSLNASVEAARAGQAGKGFAVVAEEVRSLATETRNAVSNINDNLLGFVGNIQKLVENVDEQYNILSRENETLGIAVETTNVSNLKIKDVATRMTDTTVRLAQQTSSINDLFAKMESLSAIAQENSASSEETSANIEIYTNQIRELTQQIAVFDKMIGEFKSELEKYKV